jgi:hypothetical protein
MPRITIKHLMIGIAVSAALFTAGRKNSELIEELRNPRQVRGWSSAGLILDDGRTVPLPGIRLIPSQSKVLANATGRGVEINPDGRVIGLVKVHHWCGNDPIRRHIARVDLAEMMMLLDEGSFDLDPVFARWEWNRAGRFSEYGWDMSEYCQLRTLHSALEGRKKRR